MIRSLLKLINLFLLLISSTVTMHASILSHFPYSFGIFETDDRLGLEELAENQYTQILPLLQSTVAFFDSENIHFNPENESSVYLSTTTFNGPQDPKFREKLIQEKSWSLTDDPSYQLCPDERFKNEPMGAFCTGVLIGFNKVLTASHCVMNISKCHKSHIVFGFHYPDSKKLMTQSQIYKCVNIQDKKDNLSEIIILDREVPDYIAKPIVSFDTEELKPGIPVAALGNSFGLSTKLSSNAKIINILNVNTFDTNLDTLSGNSGSLVFNAITKKMLGIVTSSMNYISESMQEALYEFDLERKCFKIRHLNESILNSGTNVLRIESQ